MFNSLYPKLTPAAQFNINALKASKNVYNLNYRAKEQTVIFDDDGNIFKNTTSYGTFVPNAMGADIFFDGSSQSLGHELGGHGFQFEQLLNTFLQYGVDGAKAAELFKSVYNYDEKWRAGIEKEAAEIGGHEYDPKIYEDMD